MQAPDERVRTKVKCIHALPERLERRCDVLRSPDFGCGDLKAELAGRCLGLAHFHYRGGIADIGHDRQPAKVGDGLAQEFECLAGSIRCLVRQPSDVAARPLRLATRPSWIGSEPISNTIGMVVVAAFAASAAGVVVAAIMVT